MIKSLIAANIMSVAPSLPQMGRQPKGCTPP